MRKEVSGDRTETKVRAMDGPERLQELAEMIGGQRITETTRAQARELLDAAVAEFVTKTRPDDARPPRPGKNGRPKSPATTQPARRRG